MTTQTELPETPSTPAEAGATNRTLPGGVTVVLERCETATRAGMRRSLQLRAYCDTYRGGIKEVSMRTEDNPASHNFELYLDLVCREVCREIEGLTQSHSEKPLLVSKRRPHTLREFAHQMVALGMLDPNHALQPTADGRENFHMKDSALNSVAHETPE
jgi:hypothetical protein